MKAERRITESQGKPVAGRFFQFASESFDFYLYFYGNGSSRTGQETEASYLGMSYGRYSERWGA